MVNPRLTPLRFVLVLTLILAFIPAAAPALGAPQRVIIAYQPVHGAAVRGQLARLGATECSDLSAENAVAVVLPPGFSKSAAAKLSGVTRVEDDLLVTMLARPVKQPPVQPVEVLPWGIDRVDAEIAWGVTTADAIKVAIVDTGIDAAHPDLVANIAGGYNAINTTVSWTDDNGHGTHVAGIVAAVNNEIGVIGVAPDVDLYAVKVLNKRGSGYTSDIIEGINWAVASGADVINMSLGSAYYSDTFAAACANAISEGVVIVAAAGNEGPEDDTVGYPAKYPGVIGVSATDSANLIASFSSRGDGVDIAAPGVSIFSTYKGSTYATLSGTSMASPHVAGAAALLLADGWAPSQVQERLQATATDLGATGFDVLYGAGLLQADAAVQ